MILMNHAMMGAAGYTAASSGDFFLSAHPGAAVAYSLRDLNGTGQSVATVRRSSDNAVLAFTASEILNGTLSTWCGASDGFVSAWHDQSENANDAAQTTHAEQPKIVTSGVVEVDLNGNPAMDFDGYDDFLIHNKVFSGTTPRSFFFVGRSMGFPSELSGIWSVRDATKNLGMDYTITHEVAFRVSGFKKFSSSFVDLANTKLLTAIWSSGDVTSTTATLNGVSLTHNAGSAATINTVDAAECVIGTTAWDDTSESNCSLRLSELIIYASDKTSERTEIEAAINGHYGIF